MDLNILPAAAVPPRRRRRKRSRRRAACSVGLLLSVACPLLSASPDNNNVVVSSTPCCGDNAHSSSHGMQSSAYPTILGRSSAASLSSRSTLASTAGTRLPSLENSAFIFSLIKKRRKNGVAPEPEALVKINGGSENGLIKDRVNGDANGHHVHYNLGDRRNGQIIQQQEQLDQTQFLDIVDIVEDEPYATMNTVDMDVVEDEPYATMHPIQDAYTKLSKPSASTEVGGEPTTLEDISESSLESMDSMEGSDDTAYYVRASYELPKDTGDNAKGSSMWGKRNARSIDEGIRFKSKLQEGLEKQSQAHRERLLSNLLEGVIDSTKGALDSQQEKMKNATNPFRWLGFGRGDKNADDDEKKQKKKKKKRNDDKFVEIDLGTSSEIRSKKKGADGTDDKSKNRKFGARTIAGLINALAEEVEGLEVEVDADPNTPIWNKSVHSIKVYFSRLGFRQLRMGGLDEVFSELESSMAPSERFALAKSFFNVGRTTTADEAFDKIDADNSGALDEEELAQALKMAAIMGGNKFGMRSKEALAEMASRLVRLYDTNGDGVVDREEYQVMVQDMAALRDARLREEMHEQTVREGTGSDEGEGKKGLLSNFFGGKEDGPTSANTTELGGDSNILDVTDNEEFWGSMDQGEGSIVLEDLKLDLRRLLFGAIPGVKRVLPGGPLILKPFTATITASFNKDDIMDSFLIDAGLRRLVARALSRRVRGIRDLLDGAVFYGRTWKLFQQNAPQVEVAKLEDVHFDRRNRLIITGRAKIKEALGYKHEPFEQGFKLRTKIGTRANGRIIGLLQPEIAIFAECPKGLEKAVRTKCKEWFGYTIPTFQPLYTYIPLVSPLKKDDKMDGFNLGEDNQIKSIYIKNGKLRFEISAYLRPGRFLGNHYLAFTVPNRTLILTLDRVREGMRIGRRNKRLAELAAREVQELAAAQKLKNGVDDDAETQFDSGKPSISPEGKVRIRRLEKELEATIQEELILREIKESSESKENGKSFISRFVEGYSGAIREELDLEMNARLSSSISDFFGSQDSDGDSGKEL